MRGSSSATSNRIRNANHRAHVNFVYGGCDVSSCGAHATLSRASACSSRMAGTSRTSRCARLRAGEDGPRVLIVTARMGAGHLGWAHELQARLSVEGCPVETVDFLDLLPRRFGRSMEALYRAQLQY